MDRAAPIPPRTDLDEGKLDIGDRELLVTAQDQLLQALVSSAAERSEATRVQFLPELISQTAGLPVLTNA